jgi:uncharacterized protein
MNLIPLSSGRSGLRSQLTIETRQPDAEAPANTLDFIASDATVDRYGEIISPAGWRLENYKRNPVFQNSHQYGDVIFTLGRALITEVRSLPSAISHLPSPCLFQRIQFAVDANPMARIAHSLYSGNFLRAVSVGFVPTRWEDGKQGDPYTRRYLEQELLEVSAVSIPANPNALAVAYKSGALGKSEIKETADLLRSIAAAGHPKTHNEIDLLGEIRKLLKHL